MFNWIYNARNISTSVWKVKNFLEQTTITTACQSTHKMAILLRTENKPNQNKMYQIETEINVP